MRDLLSPEEKAIEAVVARYQRVAPAVTRFARSLSGNEKLRVILGPDAAASDQDRSRSIDRTGIDFRQAITDGGNRVFKRIHAAASSAASGT